ncbi:MAG: helix-turn-helix domain-containing protein [Chloroflexota bacterium]|nr:helix-turn-helix domain-containing protein [Chloroflexota bacterium]
MATLVDLRAAVLPSARWLAAGPDVAPSTAASLDLAWVRLLRAGLPAFDALDPADVAIMSRLALELVASDADGGVPGLIRTCVEARIGGIVLVGEGDAAGAPASERDLGRLVSAAAAAGLPVLDAGSADAIAVERSAIGFLVNHRAELERQATLLETQLEQVALGGGGPEGLAAAIAAFLGRPIAIEGRGGSILAVHAPPDASGAAADVAAYHHRRRSAATRIALPIPGDPGASSGAFALLGERPASELERVVTARIAGLVALELARDEALGRAVEIARREPLPADGPPWVVIVARQASPGGFGDGAVPDRGGPDPGRRSSERGATDRAEPDGREALRRETLRREAMRREVRSLAPARRLSLRGDVQSVELRIVAAIDASDADGSAIGGRIAELLGRIVAVSRPFDSNVGRSSAEADARATLEAVEALTNPPTIARADRLPAYRLLGNLHNLPDGARQARALLGPLLRGRPDVRRERLATLRAVLDQPGLAEAADTLGVHRNTVAYRIRRIEEATGWRLADSELRLPLALALRLVQDE